MTRPYSRAPVDRTIHLVGDTQGITPRRRTLVLNDLKKDRTPDVAYRLQVGDFVAGKGAPELFPAAKDFMNAMGSGDWWTCIGNHDYDMADYDPPPSDAPALMGMPGMDFVVDLGYIVILSTFVRAGTGAWPTPYDTTWLDQTLGQYSDRRCAVLAHPPIFRADSPSAEAPDKEAIDAVLAEHSNCVAWLCGHTHRPMDADRMVTAIDLGPREMIHIDASAVHYTVPGVDWNDRLITQYVTFGPDEIEVRFRDHGAHQWIGGNTGLDRVWRHPLPTI